MIIFVPSYDFFHSESGEILVSCASAVELTLRNAHLFPVRLPLGGLLALMYQCQYAEPSSETVGLGNGGSEG